MSAISVSIPPVRHALVTTVELKYLNCRHSNVRIGGIRDNNVTFYMGVYLEQQKPIKVFEPPIAYTV